MTTIPSIQDSTKEERIAFVKEQWKCLNHCPSCGQPTFDDGQNVELKREQSQACLNYAESRQRKAIAKCHILKGRDPEVLYTDFIEGRMDYMDITTFVVGQNVEVRQ